MRMDEIGSSNPGEARIRVVTEYQHGVPPQRAEVYRYEWIGSRWAPVRISTSELRRLGMGDCCLAPERIDTLPWTLVRVALDDSRFIQAGMYVRDGSVLSLARARTCALVKTHARTFSVRLIRTAAIWGFGHTEPNCVPSWEDVYLVAAVRKALGKRMR